MRIFDNANFEFIAARRKAYIFSGILMLVSLVSLATRGLEMGIDFKGGMEFIVSTTSPLDATSVRLGLADDLGSAPEVKTYGADDLIVRTVGEGTIDEVQARILSGVAADYPGSNPTIEGRNVVGPRFAEDLKMGALYSILGSLLVIFLYILVRFEWKFSVGAIAALFHDVLFTLGVFSLFQGILPFSLQVDQTVIAAFLTIVGFSINDTVVIFDRIREYDALFKSENTARVMNRSINSTLSRTVITTGTVLLTVIVLFIFGGEVLRGFAFALIVGFISGTYSTVFIASPVVLELKNRFATKR